MRFTLVCTSAPRLPTNIVTTRKNPERPEPEIRGRMNRGENPQQQRKRCRPLVPRRKAPSNRRGRAFVNVRCPHLKGSSRHLEARPTRIKVNPSRNRLLEASAEERSAPGSSSQRRHKPAQCRIEKTPSQTSPAGSISQPTRSTSPHHAGIRQNVAGNRRHLQADKRR